MPLRGPKPARFPYAFLSYNGLLLEDCLGVSDRGNLAFPGSVRVYIIKPLVWDSSTGALTSF